MPGLTGGSQVLSASDIAEEINEVAALPALRESDQGKNLVALAKRWYTKCNSSRSSETLRWYRNLALYEGQQDTVLGAEGSLAEGRLVRPIQPRTKNKYRINRIRPVVRTEIARLTAQKPSCSAIPASSEDQDLAAAKAAEQILQSQFERRDLDQVFAKTAFWVSTTGNGFIKIYWDNSTLDSYSRQAGDIIYESVSPFNLLFPDLRCTDIEEQPYVIHAYTRPMEWIYHFFADRLKGVQLKASAVSANTVMDEAYYKLKGTKESQLDACMVYEIWVKPGATRLMPNGGILTLVDDHIVQFKEALPYQHQQYPFVHFQHIPSASFYTTSVIVDLEPLQLEYTDMRNQIARTRERMAKAQLVAPKGSVSAAKITNEIGLLIEYRPGLEKPTPLPLAQLPQYIFEEERAILTDMEDISGQHQVSKGNTPPGVTAATAIGFLQEKDDSYIAPTYGSIEYGFRKIGRQTLALAQQFWDLPRTVKTVGEDGVFDVAQFAGSDLVAGTDIRVEPGSALPTSKAAKQALITDWMNMGHITSEEGLALLEIGGAQKIVDQLQVDKRAAMRENLLLRHLTDQDIAEFESQWQMLQMQGDPRTIDPDTMQPLEAPPVIPVNSWDNHEVHIEIHNRYRKSQAFSILPESVKMAFEAHVNHHKLAMQADMLQQFMSQIPSDGTDPTAMDQMSPFGSLGEPAQEGQEEPGAPASDQGQGPEAPEGGLI